MARQDGRRDVLLVSSRHPDEPCIDLGVPSIFHTPQQLEPKPLGSWSIATHWKHPVLGCCGAPRAGAGRHELEAPSRGNGLSQQLSPERGSLPFVVISTAGSRLGAYCSLRGSPVGSRNRGDLCRAGPAEPVWHLEVWKWCGPCARRWGPWGLQRRLGDESSRFGVVPAQEIPADPCADGGGPLDIAWALLGPIGADAGLWDLGLCSRWQRCGLVIVPVLPGAEWPLSASRAAEEILWEHLVVIKRIGAQFEGGGPWSR
ncbi:hypothetical protein NDU88_006779 [Pleurodeles waltl]|uniref:Uncharacterized protein n=1 Tax=Pleurodeles waltl TaxID=8319 RepID=A0AAV7VMV1_PLEWA|nr:hypothetical protein NDU88_006779 [Pleurodeles waltl]